MTPDEQKWRDHFARREEEQRMLFSPREPRSRLEWAQFEVARTYLRAEFVDGQNIERPSALRADEVTRYAFFRHYGDQPRSVFCLISREWKAVRDSCSASAMGFYIQGHEFSLCARLPEETLSRKTRNKSLAEWDLTTLFARDYGVTYSGLSARWHEELWHWDGAALIHLHQFDSMLIA